MPEATPNKPEVPADETARRQREHVERLVARTAVRTEGSVQAGGRALDYRVSAAFMPVAGEGAAGGRGEPDAAVFTLAYLLQDAQPAQRPVCFAFNGGPGSASVWLHLGALGPKRVVVPDDGSTAAPPFAVQDNPHTWLQHFDLVFVDPPHTGWSTTASDAARKRMLSVDGDIEALAEVLRAWLTRHGRWGSPVFLAGESYGTTRGAGLADKLQDMGVAVSGVVLVSCAMDLQSIVFAPANTLPYALFLPAFAAVAQYHGLVRTSPERARADAEDYANGEYLAVLQAGARLSDKRHAAAARRIAELTGLPRTLVEESHLRISDRTFFFEALRHRGQIVGRLDARSTGPMAARRSRDWEFDPGIEAIESAYAMAALGYFRELGIDIETRYELLNREVNKSWDWRRGGEGGRMGMGFTSTSPDLARALRRNPHMKVLAASGRYDLGTPYSASDWSLAQLDAPAEVLARVTHRHYEAGHMMYTRQADLAQMQVDLAAWLAG